MIANNYKLIADGKTDFDAITRTIYLCCFLLISVMKASFERYCEHSILIGACIHSDTRYCLPEHDVTKLLRDVSYEHR